VGFRSNPFESGDFSNVNGGSSNSESGEYIFIAGGVRNSADAKISTVSGGKDNEIAGPKTSGGSISGGGKTNKIASSKRTRASISGGDRNRINNDAEDSVITGGQDNQVCPINGKNDPVLQFPMVKLLYVRLKKV
jgi:hypothetical protein